MGNSTTIIAIAPGHYGGVVRVEIPSGFVTLRGCVERGLFSYSRLNVDFAPEVYYCLATQLIEARGRVIVVTYNNKHLSPLEGSIMKHVNKVLETLSHRYDFERFKAAKSAISKALNLRRINELKAKSQRASKKRSLLVDRFNISAATNCSAEAWLLALYIFRTKL
jgi:hypothetical protein